MSRDWLTTEESLDLAADLRAKILQLRAENAKLHAALERHHKYHLSRTTPESYKESQLYAVTTAALANEETK